MSPAQRRSGPPTTSAAPELIDSGFALENADAPILHRGFNLADLAHVLDLSRREVIPPAARRALLGLLLEVAEMAPEEFPYAPEYGESYNSRERFFVERIGDAAGWLHAGRPRREAARIALRLHLRAQIVELVLDVAAFAREVAELSRRHIDTLMADQTYLQQAQPSTFGHYLLSFAQPALRDGARLLDELGQVNASPGGAGCVNGTRLQRDRSPLAASLGFDSVIPHTRDAMWRVDDLISLLAVTASVVSNQSKLAEDLEIFSSNEFDFVDLDDGFSRSSVLMPQKRNPYALSIVRGASGVLVGRLSGFLAVVKSPSARSDNFIFAYGEVPRALDLGVRVTRLMAGVIRTLEVHPERMYEQLARGYAQSTDLAEHLTQIRQVDYRTAYQVVGDVVRSASRAGLPGMAVTPAMLDDAARARTGASWDLTDDDLAPILDPAAIVASRQALGGASRRSMEHMIGLTVAEADALVRRASAASSAYADAEQGLLTRARSALESVEAPDAATPAPRPSGRPDS